MTQWGISRELLREAVESKKQVLITVHGTFANSESDFGDQWWQIGSPFLSRIQNQFREQFGKDLVILPFHWSGENSEHERYFASRYLELDARELELERTNYCIIAHSHGGNVLLNAAVTPLFSVTFGTPFFKYSKSGYRLPTYSKFFHFILFGSAIFLMYFFGAMKFQLFENSPILFFVVPVAAAIGATAVDAMLTNRKRAWGRYFSKPNRLLSIASKFDEAIILLEKVRELKGNFITPWKVYQMSEKISFSFSIYWLFFCMSVGAAILVATDLFPERLANVLAISTPIVMLAPFVILYLLNRFLLNSFSMRHYMAKNANSSLSKALVDSVLGNDWIRVIIAGERKPEPMPSNSDFTFLEIKGENFGNASGKRSEAIADIYNLVSSPSQNIDMLAAGSELFRKITKAAYHNAYFEDPETITHVMNEFSRPSKP